jgi:hypothetical protein
MLGHKRSSTGFGGALDELDAKIVWSGRTVHIKASCFCDYHYLRHLLCLDFQQPRMPSEAPGLTAPGFS